MPGFGLGTRPSMVRGGAARALGNSGGERIIALVDMNAFFAQVEQLCNPALRGRPVLVGGDPRTRTIVAAASYEARPFGIKAGMSYYEALKRCPAAVAVEGNPDKYLDYCYRLTGIFREFTDVVECFSIDEAFLDLTHVRLLHGPPEEIARRIKQRILDELGLTCSIGIGPNKLVAKMAADWQKPDGLTVIHPDELPHILWPLPVDALVGVGPRMRRNLARWGLTTIGRLAACDPARLRARFGVIGDLLHQWAHGIDPSPVDPEVFMLVKSMGHSYTLPRDIADEDTVSWFLFWLSDRVARRLRRDGYMGRTVSLTVRHADMNWVSRSHTLPFHTASPHEIADAALDLFRLHWPPAEPVRLLGVSLSQLVRAERSQLPLWSEGARRVPVLAAMDRVKDRYGDAAITFGTLLTDERRDIRKKIGVFLTRKEKGNTKSPLAKPQGE